MPENMAFLRAAVDHIRAAIDALAVDPRMVAQFVLLGSSGRYVVTVSRHGDLLPGEEDKLRAEIESDLEDFYRGEWHV